MEEFAGDLIEFWWKWEKVIQNGRKHCGKRRNLLLWEISPFTTVFWKDLFYRDMETRACLWEG